MDANLSMTLRRSGVLFLLATLLSVPVVLYADDWSTISSSAADIERRASHIRETYLGRNGFRGERYAEDRLADGENFYRLKDYQRAAILFMDILESYPDHPTYPDALYYFADCLFLSRDYYGARSWFEKFLSEDAKTRNSPFRRKVVARLVEVAIHLEDFNGVERYVEMLGQSMDGEAFYVKGKFLYFKGDDSGARTAFKSVKGDQTLELKAAYFAGVTLVREKRFDEALKLFEAAAKKYVKVNAAQQEILDLIRLGIGRLHYEMDRMDEAATAYEKVDRYSPYYDTALFEMASVRMRAGDTAVAERLLEVLSLAVPDSRYIPRARLLRGNLLLRADNFDEAEKVFLQTVDEFAPVKERIDAAMELSEDAASFFDALVLRSTTAMDVAGAVPAELVRWVADEPQMQRAFNVTDDLSLSQEYARESERLLHLIEAVVNSSSPVHAVPALRGAMRQALQLRNELAHLRLQMMVQVERASAQKNVAMPSFSAGKKDVAAALKALPVDEEGFSRREQAAADVYVHMRKELSRQDVVIDSMEALIVGLETYMKKPDYRAGMSEETLASNRDALQRFRAGLDLQREELRLLRADVERAEAQLGFGEDVAQEQATLKKVVTLSEQYRSHAAERLGALGKKAESANQAIARSEKAVSALLVAIEKEASTRVAEIRQILDRERERMEGYAGELSALGDEARVVVSGVARENFGGIRDRFQDLLLRADVGIIDIAWMRKEAHKAKSVNLSRERMKEIERLDAEFSGLSAIDSSGNEAP